MRRPIKIKPLSSLGQLRKSALSASAAARRAYPAWIDASEHAVAFTAVSVTPRVRDALVLRTVAKRKATTAKGSNHASGAR